MPALEYSGHYKFVAPFESALRQQMSRWREILAAGVPPCQGKRGLELCPALGQLPPQGIPGSRGTRMCHLLLGCDNSGQTRPKIRGLKGWREGLDSSRHPCDPRGWKWSPKGRFGWKMWLSSVGVTGTWQGTSHPFPTLPVLPEREECLNPGMFCVLEGK